MSHAKIPVDLILKNLEEDRKATRTRFKRASSVLTGELSTEISTTPYDVVYEEDRVKLKHYTPKEKNIKPRSWSFML